jgi:hypothetical protein
MNEILSPASHLFPPLPVIGARIEVRGLLCDRRRQPLPYPLPFKGREAKEGRLDEILG